MIGYVYVIRRDFGFAPNPFYGVCTLATCKPYIRKGAQVGDWVIGVSSQSKGCKSKLVCVMEVNKRITFDQYWDDPDFISKKPIMHGSLKQHYGDNIYHHNKRTRKWMQENSHHSKEDGAINFYNLNRDTKSDNVLISTNFYYFGKNMVSIPAKFKKEIKSIRGYKKIVDIKFLNAFLSWLKCTQSPGYNADPLLFKTSFERYDGIS